VISPSEKNLVEALESTWRLAIIASMGIRGAFGLGGTCPPPSGREVAAHGAK